MFNTANERFIKNGVLMFVPLAIESVNYLRVPNYSSVKLELKVAIPLVNALV